MREIIPIIQSWHNQGKKVALATIISAYGSAPRPLGSKMAVSSSGEMAGSVSGGCVEGAVVEGAMRVIKTGQPDLLKFGISDDTAWSVGLTCGGSIEVFVETLEWAAFETLKQNLQKERLFGVATVVRGAGIGSKLFGWPGHQHTGSLGTALLDSQVLKQIDQRLQLQQTGRETINHESGEIELFIEVFPPPPRLVIIGAVHIAIPLVGMAKKHGFHTTVIDPRKAFATPERFPHADDLVIRWPEEALAELSLDEGVYLVTLSHDDKLDVPSLKIAIENPVRYIGALGSHKTHARRVEALLEAGADAEQIKRIYTPVGLDIGALTPEEIALAVMAEIVAVRRGKLSPNKKPLNLSAGLNFCWNP